MIERYLIVCCRRSSINSSTSKMRRSRGGGSKLFRINSRNEVRKKYIHTPTNKKTPQKYI